jgi:RNA-dependent RNA polymerase
VEAALDESLRVASIQFGVYYRNTPKSNRAFAVEWNKDYIEQGRVAWLRLHYSHKCMRVQVCITYLTGALS